MTATTISSFESTIHKTNIWLKDVMEELDWDSHERAYHALRTVLHALRDRLSTQEVADLAAQLPMLVRGFYYEGWSPGRQTPADRHKEQFLAHIDDAFRDDMTINAEELARAVFHVISKHVSSGEVTDIRHTLPREIRELWE
jgi:uncharacterized protein (DUF2267 family)